VTNFAILLEAQSGIYRRIAQYFAWSPV